MKINQSAVKILNLKSMNNKILHITSEYFLARYGYSIIWGLSPFLQPPLLNSAYVTGLTSIIHRDI